MTSLTTKSTELRWDGDDFASHLAAIGNLVNEYIVASQKEAAPAGSLAPMPELQSELKPEYWMEKGGLRGTELTAFLQSYLQDSARLHHPRYMAHQVATPAIPSALAELIHGSINNPIAVYEMGPTATCLEHAVLAWMLKKVGWPLADFGKESGEEASGVLTHGGSLANLTALLAARAAVAPDAWEEGNPENLVILAPKDTHYSVARTASIMGLGAKRLMALPCDALGRIQVRALESFVEKLKAQGKQIMCLVANACATGTGLFDDLKGVGEICQRQGIWLHVDACHGGSYLLSESFKERVDGIELADSITWDAHKMLRVSSLCAAVLVRKGKHLQQAFSQQADYLFYGSQSAGIDYSHRTVECTKAALGTRLFLTLAWAGEAALGQYIDDRTKITMAIHDYLKDRDNFYCPYEVESNIVCFRYKDDDELQVDIKNQLLKSGEFHIGSTTIGKKRFLRLAVMNPDTDMKTIEALTALIESRW